LTPYVTLGCIVKMSTIIFARNEVLMITVKKGWKVGELAKQTRLSVRILHHYDQIRLLSPSHRSSSGHRIYSEADIAKLQQIISLKQLGFTLEAIKKMIESPEFNPEKVVLIQLERLNEHIRLQEQLRDQLTNIYELLKSKQDVSADQFIKLLEVMNMSEKYFTEEQLEKMKKQAEHFSPDDKVQIEKQWSELIANVRTELEKETPVDSPEAIKLAKRWQELTNAFTAGDPEIVKAAERFHAENPGNPLQYGVDGAIYKFIKQAMSYIQ
jgi:DNA-binding transcriptional MerR regulator